MTVQNDTTHDVSAFVVEPSPGSVDAGADVTMRGTLTCSPPCDLRGLQIHITDQAGTQIGIAEIAEFDGETNSTSDLVVKAPTTLGSHTWTAQLPAVEEEGISIMAVSTPLSLSVNAHRSDVVVWDVPSAIVSGETFKFKVGVKCSSACTTGERHFTINDQDGAEIAAGAVGEQIWPGTETLHYAEIEIAAPQALGLFRWQAKVPATDADLPHAEGIANFGVTFVEPPECEVTIEAIDRDKQVPLANAHVLMHPYRAVTDADGIARLQVRKGDYTIFISAAHYVTVRTTAGVSEDMTTRAALSLEVRREKN